MSVIFNTVAGCVDTYKLAPSCPIVLNEFDLYDNGPVLSAHVEARTETCNQFYKAESVTIPVLHVVHIPIRCFSNGTKQARTG